MDLTGLDTEVDPNRVARDLAVLETITSTPGRGITRLAFSDEDQQARDHVMNEMAAAGLSVRIDPAGNIFGRREGRRPDAPCVMTGSHLDSVPNGGNFDGPVGVVAALEIARVLHSTQVFTARPIEFVVFASEESPRFTAANRFGSRVMAGTFDLGLIPRLVDAEGITLAAALERRGLDPERVGDARRRPGDIAALIELHIEQGTHLAEHGAAVGVVTTITGATRYWVEFHGDAGHSGGLPMGARRDAGVAAAEACLAVETVARERGGTLVATTGVVELRPGSITVVPGWARIGIDIRDIDGAAKSVATADVLARIADICARRGIDHVVTTIRDDDPVPMDEHVSAASERASAALGIPTIRVASHTGHDAASLAGETRVGMLFTRNHSGRSHCPEEHATIEDIVVGTRALLGAVVTLADEPDLVRPGEPSARDDRP